MMALVIALSRNYLQAFGDSKSDCDSPGTSWATCAALRANLLPNSTFSNHRLGGQSRMHKL